VSAVLLLSGGAGVGEAQSNRDYVIQKMSNEIHEIIRVLQLTTYDEEEWDADDITVMKKAQVQMLISSFTAGYIPSALIIVLLYYTTRDLIFIILFLVDGKLSFHE